MALRRRQLATTVERSPSGGNTRSKIITAHPLREHRLGAWAGSLLSPGTSTWPTGESSTRADCHDPSHSYQHSTSISNDHTDPDAAKHADPNRNSHDYQYAHSNSHSHNNEYPDFHPRLQCGACWLHRVPRLQCCGRVLQLRLSEFLWVLRKLCSGSAYEGPRRVGSLYSLQ